MLQKIVYILQQVDPEANLWFDKATENVSILIKKEFEKKFNAGSLDYIRKLSVIQNSIFGVDIQPIAVEIARLRCFLSLVIEEKVYDDEPNRGINPLPNLDFKFVIANSLLDLESGKKAYQYPIYVSNDYKTLSIKKEHDDDKTVYPIAQNGVEMSWRRSPEFLMQTREEFIINHSSSGITFYKKQRLTEDIKKGKKAKSLFYKPQYSSGNGTAQIKELFDGRIFDNPKPVQLIHDMVMIGGEEGAIILDFFSGSATTAHAVMQLMAN